MSEVQNSSRPCCPACGSSNLEVIEKKGKIDTKKAIIGGVLTLGMGGIGAIAGAADMLKKERYFVCRDCGYSGKDAAAPAQGQTSRVKRNDLDPVMEPIYHTLDITLEDMALAFMHQAKTQEVPLSWKLGEITDGALNNLMGGSITPCLILFHPLHEKDYFKLAVTQERMGKHNLVQIYSFGKSTQLNIEADKGTRLIDTGGYRGSAAVGHAIGRGLVVGIRKLNNAMNQDSHALSQEKLWYSLVYELVAEVMA